MNKQDLHDWKNHPITKKVFKDIINASQEVLERSKIRDTVDQTAMQVSHDEGFIEGIEAFVDAVDDMALELVE